MAERFNPPAGRAEDFQIADRYVDAYPLAWIHLALGDKAAALAKLRQACQQRSEFVVFADALAVSPGGLRFQADAGSATLPPAQDVAIRNSGDGAITWTAVVSQPWIQLGAASGAAPANVSIAANPAGLAAGEYSGLVTITSSAGSGPQAIGVTLNIFDPTPALGFVNPSYAVSEAAGNATLSVGRSGNVSTAVSVSYAASNGTGSGGASCAPGVDYLNVSGVLTFAVDQTLATINVPVCDNSNPGANKTVNVTLTAPGAGAVLADPSAVILTIVSKAALTTVRIDIDGNNNYDALTDGLLMIRYLFGLTGTSLTAGAIGPGSTRTLPADIVLYLDSIKPQIDIDGNGRADALTDGLMILRYLFGVRGPSLIGGAIGPGATRTTAAQIEQYIQSLLP